MIVLGIVILYLILFLWMRDRKHEMGIYLAAGIGKKGIFGQLILESFLLYMAAAIAAGLCAATLSGVVGRMVFTGDTAGMTELISGPFWRNRIYDGRHGSRILGYIGGSGYVIFDSCQDDAEGNLIIELGQSKRREKMSVLEVKGVGTIISVINPY